MRIDSLDYLRGLMAVAIMVYHCFTWTYGSYESNTFLGRMGIYGVSAFYVLSGLTLYVVYQNKLEISSLKEFFVKRIFRIFPLLWLAVILNLVFWPEKEYGIEKIVLNLTGLFGFVASKEYIPTGAWSIGNELVFYLIFPFIVILSKKVKYLVEVFFLLSVLTGSYFAFLIFDANKGLGVQWEYYINPFNQLFLFVGGIFIAKILLGKKHNFFALILMLLSLLFFIFYPVEGQDKINLVFGWNRIVFSLATFSLTIAFFLNDFKINKLLDQALKKLGHISYSVYLLHPLVYWLLARQINRKEYPDSFLFLAFSVTILVSMVVYNYLEFPFVKYAKKLFQNKTSINSNQ